MTNLRSKLSLIFAASVLIGMTFPNAFAQNRAGSSPGQPGAAMGSGPGGQGGMGMPSGGIPAGAHPAQYGS